MRGRRSRYHRACRVDDVPILEMKRERRDLDITRAGTGPASRV